jgi:hypothetical protein
MNTEPLNKWSYRVTPPDVNLANANFAHPQSDVRICSVVVVQQPVPVIIDPTSQCVQVPSELFSFMCSWTGASASALLLERLPVRFFDADFV